MMDVWQTCPMLIPLDEENTYFDGFISVLSQDFRVCITLPDDKCLKHARLECDWSLKQLLQGYEPIINQRLGQCLNLAEFLKELKILIERQVERLHVNNSVTTKASCQLLSELEGIGWHRLANVSPNFREVHLRFVDEGNRNHILKIYMHAEHPKIAPTFVTDLPAKVDWSSSSTLHESYSQFQKAVNSYQSFFNILAEIDRKTWVLEPEKPTFAATCRRIAIGTNVSIQVNVDPKHPQSLLECRFMGADHLVAPLRKNFNTNLHKWDVGRSLLRNLEDLLDVSFPSPTSTEKGEFSLECGICYAYRLGTELPDKVCDNSKCGQPYHLSCLYEWLRSLPSTRQSFNTTFGECPLCTKPLTVTMPFVK